MPAARLPRVPSIRAGVSGEKSATAVAGRPQVYARTSAMSKPTAPLLQSFLDLSSPAGQNVLFRFRFARRLDP